MQPVLARPAWLPPPALAAPPGLPLAALASAAQPTPVAEDVMRDNASRASGDSAASVTPNTGSGSDPVAGAQQNAASRTSPAASDSGAEWGAVMGIARALQERIAALEARVQGLETQAMMKWPL